MQALIDAMDNIVIVKDGQGRWLEVNRRGRQTLGFCEDSFKGKTTKELSQTHPVLQQVVQWDSFADEEAWNTPDGVDSQLSLVHADGRTVTYAVRKVPEFLPDGTRAHLYVLLRDTYSSNVLIEHLTHHDELTGLPNRKAFEKQLALTVQRADAEDISVAVACLDVDGMKFVNDAFGHSMGDTLLATIADRVKECLPSTDFVARGDGDEFLLLLRDVHDIDVVIHRAEGILKVIDHPVLIQNHNMHVTGSVGVSLFPAHGQDAAELLKCADIARHQAVQHGRNQLRIYQSEMNEETRRRFVIRNELYTVLQTNALVLHYQPRICTSSYDIVGAEALIRWEHPDLGTISPLEFIPLAEESGMIIPIGEWVLRTVCMQNKQWQQSGLPHIPISVNVSAKQIADTNFVNTVKSALESAGLDGEWLELELTESALSHNEQVVKTSIQALQQMGVHVAIDDFGTGYSSLSQLHTFKFNTVKIDRSFIMNLHEDPDSARITASIIELAHGLGMRVVVEGVETEKQAVFLQEKTSDELQGFLFSRPISKDAFASLLLKGRLPHVSFSDNESRRGHARFNFSYPLAADMEIHVSDTGICIGRAKVQIQDIGPGGLRFSSNIRFDSNAELVLTFRADALGHLELSGTIAWRGEYGQDVVEYGVEFIIDEDHRSSLTEILTATSLRLGPPVQPQPDGVHPFPSHLPTPK